jgi:multisubunit Na+/H+ antiporter MnhG subunit
MDSAGTTFPLTDALGSTISLIGSIALSRLNTFVSRLGALILAV